MGHKSKTRRAVAENRGARPGLLVTAEQYRAIVRQRESERASSHVPFDGYLTAVLAASLRNLPGLTGEKLAEQLAAAVTRAGYKKV